jgi:hypothetical protein
MRPNVWRAFGIDGVPSGEPDAATDLGLDSWHQQAMKNSGGSHLAVAISPTTWAIQDVAEGSPSARFA